METNDNFTNNMSEVPGIVGLESLDDIGDMGVVSDISEISDRDIMGDINEIIDKNHMSQVEQPQEEQLIMDHLIDKSMPEFAQVQPTKKKIRKHFRKDQEDITEVTEGELPIIEMYRVYKSYQPGLDAVKNINFRIKKGEFVFIVGHSGSGKTTLMNLMMNAIRPTSGRVYVNGYELTRLHKRKIAKFRRGIGVVFQDFKLLGDRDVFENIAFAQRVIEKTTRQVKKNVPEVLSLVGLMDKQKALPSELSGGEQQRVAIARALVNQPTILLADEPTGNLDPKTAWEIMDLLEEINRRGTTVIVVTHNMEIVEAMKKRVITIEKGNIVEDGIKGEIKYETKNGEV